MTVTLDRKPARKSAPKLQDVPPGRLFQFGYPGHPGKIGFRTSSGWAHPDGTHYTLAEFYGMEVREVLPEAVTVSYTPEAP